MFRMFRTFRIYLMSYDNEYPSLYLSLPLCLLAFCLLYFLVDSFIVHGFIVRLQTGHCLTFSCSYLRYEAAVMIHHVFRRQQ